MPLRRIAAAGLRRCNSGTQEFAFRNLFGRDDSNRATLNRPGCVGVRFSGVAASKAGRPRRQDPLLGVHRAPAAPGGFMKSSSTAMASGLPRQPGYQGIHTTRSRLNPPVQEDRRRRLAHRRRECRHRRRGRRAGRRRHHGFFRPAERVEGQLGQDRAGRLRPAVSQRTRPMEAAVA